MKRQWVQIVAVLLLVLFGYFWIVAPSRQAHRMTTELPRNPEAEEILKYIGDRIHGRIRLKAPDRITMENVIETLERDELWNYLSNLIDETPRFFYDEIAHDRLWNSLSSGLQMTYFLVEADSQMLNGGIRQFMQNMSPYEIEESVKAFQKIGANESVKLFEQAIAVYDSKGSWKPGARSNYPDMANWSDDEWENHPILEAIDDARCKSEASHRDWKLFHEYVRMHPEEFLHDRNLIK